MYGRRRAKKKYTGIGFALFTHFPSLDKQRRQIYIVLNAWFYCITTYKVFVTNAYILKGNITGAPSVCSMVNFDFSQPFHEMLPPGFLCKIEIRYRNPLKKN